MTTSSAQQIADRLSARGVLLTLTTLFVAGSAIPSLRPELGGLLLHPLLAPLGLLFLISLPRFAKLRSGLVPLMVAFVTVYSLSTVPNEFDPGEVAKIATAGFMILVSAVAIDSRRDFRFAILGLAVALTVISVRGLLNLDNVAMGANPMEEIANKNAFSLYALPAILLGGHLSLDTGVGKGLRIAVLMACMLTVATVFSTGNRSGWAGVALVAVMLIGASFIRNRGAIRAGVAVLLIGAFAFLAIREWGTEAVVEQRMEVTFAGYQSDTTRWELFVECVRIGVEHPFLGVSPDGLALELARRTANDSDVADPHNVIGHVFGGSGAISLLLLIALGANMFLLPRNVRWVPGPDLAAAQQLLRMLLVLWVFRGLFTREVLYNPAFCIGLGICLGLVDLERRMDPEATRVSAALEDDGIAELQKAA